MRTPPARVIGRVLADTVTVEGSGCIETTRGTGSHGYGQMSWGEDGEQFYGLTHRIAWYAAHGDIPDHLTVDHICHNRRCVNVDHLRLLTPSDNGKTNGQTLKTHCPRGHEYDEANTYLAPSGTGGRRCRACAAATDCERTRLARLRRLGFNTVSYSR